MRYARSRPWRTGKYLGQDRFTPGTDYRSGMPQFTPEAVRQNRELLRLIADMADAKHATSAQISLAWMLCKKPWIVPIPGSRKIERLQENAQAADIQLSADEVRGLDAALDSIPMSAVFGGHQAK